MFYSKITPPGHTDASRQHAMPAGTDRVTKCFSPQPKLLGDFSRAAYHGALEVSAQLAAAGMPNPQLAILTDMYVHWQHEVAYKVGDAQMVTALEVEQVFILIARLCRQGVVRRYRHRPVEDEFHIEERIELVPAYRADLSGYFARVNGGGQMQPVAQATPLNLS